MKSTPDPLRCHRWRIDDRIVFDKIAQALVLGAAYEKVADSSCSATTIRRRRDDWIDADIFAGVEQACGAGLSGLLRPDAGPGAGRPGR
jgi:hypothetical protein